MDARVKKLIEANYADQRSDEWLALRKTMLTASDVATALGLNPYEKPERLIYKKCGALGFRGNAATLHGQQYEPIARDMYIERTGEIVHEIGLVVHPKYPWIGGSPDGITESGKLIEIKCPMSRKIDGTVPKHYMPQIQVLLDILDMDVCDFVQLNAQTGEFSMTRVDRDRAWFEWALPELSAFWNRVVERRSFPLCEIMVPSCSPSAECQDVHKDTVSMVEDFSQALDCNSSCQTDTCTQSSEVDSATPVSHSLPSEPPCCSVTV